MVDPHRLVATAPPAHWDFPRSPAGLAVLCEYGRALGVGEDVVLAGTAVAPASLLEPGETVAAGAELTAVRNLVRAAGGRAHGAALGRRYHVSTFGILGFALMSSRTVGQAFELALRFLDLSYIFSIPTLELDDDRVRVTLAPSGLPSDIAGFLVERDLVAIANVLDELVPGGLTFSEVAVAVPDPGPAQRADFAAVLGDVTTFGAERTSFAFAVAELDRHLPQGNPHGLAVAEAMCRDVVAGRRHLRVTPGLVEEVRVWITQNLTRGPDAGRAAAALAMSERTLRRRLSGAGVGFQVLLDEVRESLALEMLATGKLSVEDVALRLGYAEASSFIHAFRRWRGSTPARFQRAVLAR